MGPLDQNPYGRGELIVLDRLLSGLIVFAFGYIDLLVFFYLINL